MYFGRISLTVIIIGFDADRQAAADQAVTSHQVAVTDQ